MADVELSELSDADYLRNLSRRIFKIPANYGTDQYDYDRLREIAEQIDDVVEEVGDEG